MAFLIPSRALSAVLLGILSAAIGPAQTFNEYQVKAAFLYSFAKFVEWPPQTFSSRSAPMAICVLGEDPFGNFLDDAVRGKTVNDRQLTVHRLPYLPSLPECKILFVAASERRQMSAVLAAVSAPGLLTVGDTPEFTAQGGVIGLRLDGERIRLTVNLAAAEKANVRISSRVLSLATLVK